MDEFKVDSAGGSIEERVSGSNHILVFYGSGSETGFVFDVSWQVADKLSIKEFLPRNDPFVQEE